MIWNLDSPTEHYLKYWCLQILMKLQQVLLPATWTEITVPTLPTVDNVFVNSDLIDLSSFNSDNVHIAFKYIGSKAGSKTTTFQLDNIKIFENK